MSDSSNMHYVEEPLTRKYRQLTGGTHPAVDRLGTLLMVLEEMDNDRERRAAIGYIANRYDIRIL